MNLRKFALTIHVASSVGWFGAVATFLALSIFGLYAPDAQVRQAMYVAMGAATWWVIVPLSGLAMLSGALQSFITPWGLLRHYWVATKGVISVVASALLLLHTQPIDAAYAASLNGNIDALDAQLRLKLIVDACAAVIALAVATALSVYKPIGLTPYGIRAASSSEQPALSAASRRWNYIATVTIVVIFVAAVLRHLAGDHGH